MADAVGLRRQDIRDEYRNVGLGIKEFKKGVTEGSKNEDKDEIGKAGPADERERGTTP